MPENTTDLTKLVMGFTMLRYAHSPQRSTTAEPEYQERFLECVLEMDSAKYSISSLEASVLTLLPGSSLTLSRTGSGWKQCVQEGSEIVGRRYVGL